MEEEEWVDIEADGDVDRATRYDDYSLEEPTNNSNSGAEEWYYILEPK